MTRREEAIKCLKSLVEVRRKYGDMQTMKDEIECLEMAIKALEQEPIIDKIRVEIEQLRLHKAEFLTNDNKVCIDSQAVLNIIDKYKQKSEEQKEYEAEIITRGNCMICGKELTEGLFICKECEDKANKESEE